MTGGKPSGRNLTAFCRNLSLVSFALDAECE